MNLNELLKKNDLTEEEYVELKKQAYFYAANHSKEEIINHIQQLKLKETKKTYPILIYYSTLTFPNDKDFLEQLENNNLGKIYIKEKLNMPLDIIHFKINEFEKYKTKEMLGKHLEIAPYADQMSQFELKTKHSR